MHSDILVDRNERRHYVKDKRKRNTQNTCCSIMTCTQVNYCRLSTIVAENRHYYIKNRDAEIISDCWMGQRPNQQFSWLPNGSASQPAIQLIAERVSVPTSNSADCRTGQRPNQQFTWLPNGSAFQPAIHLIAERVSIPTSNSPDCRMGQRSNQQFSWLPNGSASQPAIHLIAKRVSVPTSNSPDCQTGQRPNQQFTWLPNRPASNQQSTWLPNRSASQSAIHLIAKWVSVPTNNSSDC